jgi:hypothetical protein
MEMRLASEITHAHPCRGIYNMVPESISIVTHGTIPHCKSMLVTPTCKSLTLTRPPRLHRSQWTAASCRSARTADKTDDPDPVCRQPQLCGMDRFSGATARWTRPRNSGSLYNPDDGKNTASPQNSVRPMCLSRGYISACHSRRDQDPAAAFSAQVGRMVLAPREPGGLGEVSHTRPPSARPGAPLARRRQPRAGALGGKSSRRPARHRYFPKLPVIEARWHVQ